MGKRGEGVVFTPVVQAEKVTFMTSAGNMENCSTFFYACQEKRLERDSARCKKLREGDTTMTRAKRVAEDR
jgi:hypothetical protein